MIGVPSGYVVLADDAMRTQMEDATPLRAIGQPDHIAAPFAGVVTVGVAEGDSVEAGQTIATIEAMKMEAAITAPKGGTVTRVAVSATAQVEGGDLLVVVGSAGRSEAAGEAH